MKIYIFLFGIGLFLASCTHKSMNSALDSESGKAKIQTSNIQETESYYTYDFEAWESAYVQSSEFRKFANW